MTQIEHDFSFETDSVSSYSSESSKSTVHLAQLPRPRWEQDSDITHCPLCKTKFGFITRKHHCRACGKIICAQCSKHEKSLTQLGYSSPQRVCDSCYTHTHSNRRVTNMNSEELSFDQKTTVPFYPPGSYRKSTSSMSTSKITLHYFNVHILESTWGNCTEISCSIDNFGIHWKIKNSTKHTYFKDLLAVKKSKGSNVYSTLFWFPWVGKNDKRKREERRIAIMHMSATDKNKFHRVVASGIAESSPAALTKPILMMINTDSADNQQASKVYESVSHIFDLTSQNITMCEMYEPQDASEVIAEQDMNKYAAIVSCGGDSVIMHVFTALMARPDSAIIVSKLPVYQIPTGHHIGYSASIFRLADPLTASFTIAKQCHRPLDLIQILMDDQPPKHAGLYVAWGMLADAETSLRWLTPSKSTFNSLLSLVSKNVFAGKVSYLPAENQTMSFCNGESCTHCHEASEAHQTSKAPHTMDLQDRENWVVDEGEFMMVTGCNMSDLSQNARIAPYAHPSDGCIDLIIIRNAPMAELAKLLTSLKTGSYVNNPNFYNTEHYVYVKVKAFTIEPRDTTVFSFDGTKCKTNQAITCSILPSAACIG